MLRDDASDRRQGAITKAQDLMDGKVRGRVVVKTGG